MRPRWRIQIHASMSLWGLTPLGRPRPPFVRATLVVVLHTSLTTNEPPSAMAAVRRATVRARPRGESTDDQGQSIDGFNVHDGVDTSLVAEL